LAELLIRERKAGPATLCCRTKISEGLHLKRRQRIVQRYTSLRLPTFTMVSNFAESSIS
jgi:hypothetical protein